MKRRFLDALTVALGAILLLHTAQAHAAVLVPWTTIPTAVGTSAMTSGDVDGDGHLDLVVANQTDGTVSIFHGDGQGGFTREDIPVGAGPAALALGDLNHDGLTDLAVANEGDHTLMVFEGGKKGFRSPRTFSIGPDIRSIFFRVGPTFTDVLVARDQAVEVFRGHGPHGINAAGIYPFTAGFGEVLSGDFDGDGQLDLLGVGTSTFALMHGRTDGGFDGHQDLGQTNGWFWWAAAGDLTGDGVTDLCAGTYASWTASVSLQAWTSAVTAGAAVPSPDLGLPVAVGDVDGDGHADVVIVKSHSTGCALFLGDGSGGLRLEGQYATGGRPFKAEIGDFDEDGRNDVATLDYDTNTITLLRNAGGTVARAVGHQVPSAPIALPKGIALLAPAPGSGSNGSRIGFLLPRATEIDLAVFDVSGRVVGRLAHGAIEAGTHFVEWMSPGSGVYFVRLVTPDARATRRFIVVH